MKPLPLADILSALKKLDAEVKEDASDPYHYWILWDFVDPYALRKIDPFPPKLLRQMLKHFDWKEQEFLAALPKRE